MHMTEMIIRSCSRTNIYKIQKQQSAEKKIIIRGTRTTLKIDWLLFISTKQESSKSAEKALMDI